MIKIVGDRLLVRAKEIEKKTESGIVLVQDETRLEKAVTSGTVVQVGPCAYEEDPEPWCKEGDRIVYGKYVGYWITDPETEDEYLVLDPHDVLCVITGEAK